MSHVKTHYTHDEKNAIKLAIIVVIGCILLMSLFQYSETKGMTNSMRQHYLQEWNK